MKVLVIGSGAREHALAWKILRSEKVEELYAFPGNAGIEEIAEIPKIKNSVDDIAAFAEKEAIDLVVIGPEDYLAKGLADILNEKGISVFGPSREAAELEASKAFAKDMMKEAAIPTARYFTVNSMEEGKKILHSLPYPLVLKADGLAAGKGVVIVQTPEEGERELEEMLSGKFNDAGKKVVIEEFLKGEELSLLFFVDGDHYRALSFSQDHKAIYDGDKGPNTGGMGAYTPVSIGTPELRDRVAEKVVEPLISAMKKRGIVFKGVLYAGLMIVENEPYVLEFNVRFGDPETEALLFHMKSDIIPYLVAVAEGRLSEMPEIQWNEGYSATVVMASEGYPGSYPKGLPISGLDRVSSSTVVFHAGTASRQDGTFITNGGRVLMVTSSGTTMKKAVEKAYENVSKIHFDGAYFRRDIGKRELERENEG